MLSIQDDSISDGENFMSDFHAVLETRNDVHALVMAGSLAAETSVKLQKLTEQLSSYEGIIVAYSGGMDSCLLAYMAHQLQPEGSMLAVTANSEIYPTQETEKAVQVATELGFPAQLLNTNELANQDFAENSPLRCYFCKQELYGAMNEMAQLKGFACVIDGQNMDDRKDYRPGAKAGRELGIDSPFQDVGMTKAEISEISRLLNLPTWDKPPQPCLSTRFPYGARLSVEGMSLIEQAEAVIRSLGLEVFRLRLHDDIARLELKPEDWPIILDGKTKDYLIRSLQDLGIVYITLDLEGFASGSMNKALKKKSQDQVVL